MRKNECKTGLREESDIMSVGKEVNGYNQEKAAASPVETLFEWLDSFIISLVAVILLFTLFIGKVEVDGSSMVSTLNDRDQLIISDFNYTPAAGDIVIISRNYSNTEEGEKTADKPLVKRVIATEGQTVEIKDGDVYVDGVKLNEPYLDPQIVPNGTPNRGFDGKQTVPQGCIFVMGDNRPVSHDSRAQDIGFIDTKYVLGRVLFKIYPLDSISSYL